MTVEELGSGFVIALSLGVVVSLVPLGIFVALARASWASTDRSETES